MAHVLLFFFSTSFFSDSLPPPSFRVVLLTFFSSRYVLFISNSSFARLKAFPPDGFFAHPLRLAFCYFRGLTSFLSLFSPFLRKIPYVFFFFPFTHVKGGRGVSPDSPLSEAGILLTTSVSYFFLSFCTYLSFYILIAVTPFSLAPFLSALGRFRGFFSGHPGFVSRSWKLFFFLSKVHVVSLQDVLILFLPIRPFC